MARRRPREVRAARPARRAPRVERDEGRYGAKRHPHGARAYPGVRRVREVDGLSRRVLAEIDRLERTRNYLFPGAVTDAVLLWQDFARRPAATHWSVKDADLEFYCCGDPFAARELLTVVEGALSRPAARALRAVLAAADARWAW
ncbi:hypothetical protein ACIBI4_02725 [Streptomyces sp. NPDC050418]|uniref:hypothetical protein n=1 Tax=Streptomyces sp. NPDC050418 TaxID=3365612 RepID=UPI0037A09ADE